MPRLMSFALTTKQIHNRTKTVTRRKGWGNLKPGQLFWAVEKCMGLRPGEQVKRLALLRCVSNTAEELRTITPADVEREGFSGLSPKEFVAMFCKHMGGEPDQVVQRIEFEFTEKGPKT